MTSPTRSTSWGHLDVVAPGEGWTVTQPYSPKWWDGMLFGGGVEDDKGPVIASLLAMKAVKDLGVPLKANCRMIMGTNEESGSGDIAWYFARNPYAPATFSPDAGFPVINTEKGGFKPTFSKSWPVQEQLPRLRWLHGGFRSTCCRGCLRPRWRASPLRIWYQFLPGISWCALASSSATLWKTA